MIVNTVSRKRTELVLRLSDKVPQIQELNSSFHFYSYQAGKDIPILCPSKREYDRVDLTEFFIDHISANKDLYYDLISKAANNWSAYSRYLECYETIMRTNSPRSKKNYRQYGFFQELEKQLCKKHMLDPLRSLQITVTKSYVSPKGRNHYSETAHFSTPEVIDCYQAAARYSSKPHQEKYQREPISASLRYDILKRDGFRCVLCGASVEDGVKLHIDHILPVSKGGKTVPENLRTLCDRCNFGKRDKYDPGGLN